VRIEKKLSFDDVQGIRVGYAPIGKPLISVIFYYIDGLLIDTVSYNTRPSLQRFILTNPMDQLALTHYHEDHAGNADFLEKKLSVPVYGHPVHTPGHSIDHVIYHDRDQGWVFSVDLFLGANIKFFRKDEDILQTINSLEKTITLDFDRLFCGHNPKMDDPKSYLGAKLEQLLLLMDEVK